MHLNRMTDLWHSKHGTLRVVYSTDRVGRKVKEIVEVYTIDDTFGGPGYTPPGIMTWVEKETQKDLNEENRLEDNRRDNTRYL